MGLSPVIALVLFALPAGADTIYRCDTADGGVEFRDFPCDAPAPSIQSTYQAPDRDGLRPGERRMLGDARARDARRRAQRQAAREARQAAAAERDALQAECPARRRALERLRDRMRAGYRASESAGLLAREREHMDFIGRNCR